MTNKDFLTWVHSRMIHVHGENKHSDYMQRLSRLTQEVEDTENDLLSLKTHNSAHLDQLRDLLLEIRKGGQAHIECTDRTSPTSKLIFELCK